MSDGWGRRSFVTLTEALRGEGTSDTLRVVGPTFVWNREHTEKGELTGTSRMCPLEGCTGVRLYVRWPDGKITYPCTKGMIETNGEYQIG